jgi:hypothetical protein
MHTIRHQCIYRFNTCYPECYMAIHGYFGGNGYPHHWRLIVTYIVKAPPITTDAIIIWKIKWHHLKLICVRLKCLMPRFIYGTYKRS